MKIGNIKVTGLIILCTMLLSSCVTYHLSTESLMQQLAYTQKEKKVNIIVAFPLVFPGVVNGNNLRDLRCFDKNEQEHTIPVTNRTSIRITKKDGKRKQFYFDTLIIKDSMITGKNDHFLGINIKPINLNNISKIELQN